MPNDQILHDDTDRSTHRAGRPYPPAIKIEAKPAPDRPMRMHPKNFFPRQARSRDDDIHRHAGLEIHVCRIHHDIVERFALKRRIEGVAYHGRLRHGVHVEPRAEAGQTAVEMQHGAVTRLVHNEPLYFLRKRPCVVIVAEEKEALKAFLKLIHSASPFSRASQRGISKQISSPRSISSGSKSRSIICENGYHSPKPSTFSPTRTAFSVTDITIPSTVTGARSRRPASAFLKNTPPLTAPP